MEEVEVDLRSTDPLGFPGLSGAAQEGASTNAGDTDAHPDASPARSTRCR